MSSTPSNSPETAVCDTADRARIWEILGLPERLLAFDFETTGVEPKSDYATELGAVWVTPDGCEPAFDQLFNVPVKLTPFISRLTGITDQMLKTEQPFSHYAAELDLLFRSAPALLGHNVAFDINFIIQELKRNGRALTLPPFQLDTRNLARLVFPEAPPGGLGGFSRWLGITHDRPHRAISDAHATGEVFLASLPRLQLLSREECQQLEQLARISRYGIPPESWKRLAQHLKPNATRKLPLAPWPPAIRNASGTSSIHPADTVRALSNGGITSQRLQGFRERKGQLNYADRVLASLDEQSWSIIEAGTGVGKTFGYLAPVLSWLSEDSSRRAVISTYSKTLQHQLFHKDLPFWLDQYNNISAVLLKGRSNYVCPHRYEELVDRAVRQNSASDAYNATTLPLWLSWTTTGDQSELVTLREGSSTYARVVSDPFRCSSRGCPNNTNECFFARIRKQASQARLIIVNHALLCNYLLNQPQLLGTVNCFILDEGHRLEEVARDAVAFEWSRNLLTNLQEQWQEIHGDAQVIPNQEHLHAIAQDMTQLEGLWVQFVKLFISRVQQVPESEYGRRQRIATAEGLAVWFPEASDLISDRLQKIQMRLPLLKEQISRSDELKAQIDSLLLRVTELTQGWHRLLVVRENDTVWWELAASADATEITFSAAPVDVAPALRESLFKPENFGVITSATLSINENFSYLRNNIGANGDEIQVNETTISSPFALDRQLKIAVPMFDQDPWQSGQLDVDAVANWLAPELLRQPINSLVLATARKVGTAIAKAFQNWLTPHNRTVWLQGPDGSPSELVEQFRTQQGGMLIGYDSFWEGIDLPGTELELIIIPRLPFPVPDEPVQAAKAEAAAKQGLSDFHTVSLPQAVLKLKQGVGRMIRKEADHGIILILDRRILTARYSGIIRKSLPVPVQPIRSRYELADLFDQFRSKS